MKCSPMQRQQLVSHKASRRSTGDLVSDLEVLETLIEEVLEGPYAEKLPDRWADRARHALKVEE